MTVQRNGDMEPCAFSLTGAEFCVDDAIGNGRYLKWDDLVES
jgi:hypothetical protein